MRIKHSGVGLVLANPTLFRSVLASVALHIALLGIVGENQQKPSSSLLAPSSAIHATLIRSQVSAEKSEPSLTPTDTHKTLQSGTTVDKRTDTTFLARSSTTKPDRRDTPLLNIIETPPLHYFTQHELDVPPYVLTEPVQESPAPAESQESGWAVVDLWIDDSGLINRIELVESDLSDGFLKKELNTFATTIFSAGRKNNQAVHSRIRMKIYFQPESLRPIKDRRTNAPQRLVPP